MTVRILGIETSCDETGVAVVDDSHTILAERLASQIAVHAPFGGVVPEIASRQHTKVISRLTEEVLEEAGPGIDAVAATNGPGLMGSLLVGVNFAKALSYAWKIPFIPVHHIEGHIYSTFLSSPPPDFPLLALIVSGGHTQLIYCPSPLEYQILGSTRDDAVGESFDKVARLLNLPYPGGPSIQKAAESGDPRAFDFPRPFLTSETLEFSYSGLKTAVLYQLQKTPEASVPDIAASFQAAAVEVLIVKTLKALEQTNAPCLIVAGGVASNQHLRDELARHIQVPVHLPPKALCVDNGPMIAQAGLVRYKHNEYGDLRTTPRPGISMSRPGD